MILRFKLPKYNSPKDEEFFFSWLNSISSIGPLKGIGCDIVVDVLDEITEQDFWEVVALFARYKINFGVLRAVENDLNRDWLTNKKSHWYKKVYGK